MLESELFALLEGTADAAFAVDELGVIRFWNKAAEKLFGYSGSAVLQKPCAQLFQGRGSLGNAVCQENCPVLQCSTESHPVPNYDMEIKAQAGRRLWVNISIIEFKDQRIKRRLHIHLARDISSRKKRDEWAETVLGAAKDLVTLAPDHTAAAPISPLSKQEKRVLKLLSEGKSPAESARLLSITGRTLRNHLYNANQKLGTRNRLEAVIHAIRRGLI